jgi:hypothetical protein
MGSKDIKETILLMRLNVCGKKSLLDDLYNKYIELLLNYQWALYQYIMIVI